MPEARRLPALLAAARAAAAVAATALAAALAGACSLNYEQAKVAEQLAPEIPDTVMLGFTHTVVSDGRVWVRLWAQRAEGYDQAKKIVLTGVRFQEFDSQGQLATEGVADRAVYHSDSENAEVSGHILIRALGEKASLSAESLSWVRAGRRLSSGAGQLVRLAKEDGSFLEGRGFQADFSRRRLEFSQGASGGYVEAENAGR
jgi:LPS export ABC transporter protein LptC